MDKDELDYGIVKIAQGIHKGRIGEYDDDYTDKKAIIYFGSMYYVREYFCIPHKYLAQVTTLDLIYRSDEIDKIIGFAARNVNDTKLSKLLAEMSLIDHALFKRVLHSRTITEGKKNVFISHSSKDKRFARLLATDLTQVGHLPWLDEWKIKVGESIPCKISQGISECDAMIVILSEHAVESKWVENEWQAKYWDEVQKGHVMILPVLLRACEIPPLLKNKRYADFRTEFESGFNDLLIALGDNT
jgi:hypothetical protein